MCLHVEYCGAVLSIWGAHLKMLYLTVHSQLFPQCRTEFRQNGPVLIIAPATSVDNWHSNWEFWGGLEVNVVSYVGSTAARALLHDHELWLSPESLDSKIQLPAEAGPARQGELPATFLVCMAMSSYTVLQDWPDPSLLHFSFSAAQFRLLT